MGLTERHNKVHCIPSGRSKFCALRYSSFFNRRDISECHGLTSNRVWIPGHGYIAICYSCYKHEKENLEEKYNVK